MKFLGSIKGNIYKDKYAKYLPHSDIAEVTLVHYNDVNFVYIYSKYSFNLKKADGDKFDPSCRLSKIVFSREGE